MIKREQKFDKNDALDELMISKHTESGCQTDRKQYTALSSDFSFQNYEMIKLLQKKNGKSDNVMEIKQPSPLRLIQQTTPTSKSKFVINLGNFKHQQVQLPSIVKSAQQPQVYQTQTLPILQDYEYKLEHYKTSPRGCKPFSCIFRQLSGNPDDPVITQRFELPQYKTLSKKEILIQQIHVQTKQNPNYQKLQSDRQYFSQLKLQSYDIAKQSNAMQMFKKQIKFVRNHSKSTIKHTVQQKPMMENRRNTSMHITQYNWVSNKMRLS